MSQGGEADGLVLPATRHFDKMAGLHDAPAWQPVRWRNIMARIRWKAQLSSQDIAPLVATAENSIIAIQTAIQMQHPFVPYNAGGAQHAVTTVTWPPLGPAPYRTTLQQHSEMVAVAASTAPTMPIWTVNGAGHVVANNGHAITGANYLTNLPHCGYCTIMLWVLSLPLGAATAGRYNLAVNLDYTVPPNIFNNVDILTRLLNSNMGGNAALIVLKRMINPFLQNASADWVLSLGPNFISDHAVTPHAPPGALPLTWAAAASHDVDVNVMHFGTRPLIATLWKIIFQAIYNNVH